MRLATSEKEISAPKILIYGKPGVGKTTLAAQAPRPTLILETDPGGASWLWHSEYVNPTGLHIAHAVSCADIEEIALAMSLGKLTKYRSVIVDTLTELQEMHRRIVMSGKLRPTQGDYGATVQWLKQQLHYFQISSTIVVYVCLQSEDTDEDGLHLRPAISNSVLRSLEGYMHGITYLGTRLVEESDQNARIERVAISQNRERIRAKDRTGFIPNRVRDPGWESLYGPLCEIYFASLKAKQEKKEEASNATAGSK